MPDLSKIRLAEPPPVRCSSCFGQYPERRHVDFGAAFDGPTFERDESEVAGGGKQAIDDLIVCDFCLSAAAALLGFGDVDELSERLEQTQERIENLTERNTGLVDYVSKLESAAASRDGLEQALSKPRESEPEPAAA